MITAPATAEQKENVRPDDPIERAMQAFSLAGYGYGDTIRTEWFAGQFDLAKPVTAADLDRYRMLYAQYLGRLKQRLLIEKHIALRTKPGVGQEIVRPAEQTAWAMEDARSVITSEIEKARDRVSNINLEQLSEGEKAENRDAIAKLSFFRQNRLKEI